MRDYSSYACPNASCSLFAHSNSGNIRHRSWTGKNKNIERLICIACKKEFSERKGTLMECSKLTSETQELILKCFRWGVCEEGIADICQTTVKTVRLFQDKVATRAFIHHDEAAKELQDPAIECDEMHVKIGKDKNFWLAAAIAVPSLFIVALAFGNREAYLADKLMAEVFSRMKALVLILTDGWKCYMGAISRCFGRLYQPRRKGRRGRNPHKRLKLKEIFYAQVVKLRDEGLKLLRIEHRALCGKMHDILFFMKTYGIGNKIHTIHIERWWASLRNSLASCKRRGRCRSKTRTRQRKKIWIWASLYNWVLVHQTLSKDTIPTTPAMKAGLIDHPLSYQEYIWMRVFKTEKMRDQVKSKLEEMNQEVRTKASQKMRIKPQKTILFTTERMAA
jgi:IS1 family transposase